MRKFNALLVSGSLAVAGMAASMPALAELSANAGLVSNYVFRGLTQTDDGVAVQGGLDYSNESGFYAGTWASTVDNGVGDGLEIDLYAGFAGEMDGFGYDIGFIDYEYTDDKFFDGAFREVMMSGSYGPASLAYYMGDDTSAGDNDYTYLEVGVDFELPSEVGMSVHFGSWEPDTGASVTDYSLGASKSFEGFDLGAAFTSEDGTDEDEFFISVSKSFDL